MADPDPKDSDPFNGADPAKFDHDGDGKPGGRKANGVRLPYVEAASGGVVILTAADARKRGASVRAATEQDLRVAGREDLIPSLPQIAD